MIGARKIEEEDAPTHGPQTQPLEQLKKEKNIGLNHSNQRERVLPNMAQLNKWRKKKEGNSAPKHSPVK